MLARLEQFFSSNVGLVLLFLCLGLLAFGGFIHPWLGIAGAAIFGGGMMVTVLVGLVQRLSAPQDKL